MQWVNALSQLPSLEAALRQVVEEAKAKLQVAQLKSALTRQVQAVGSGSLPGLLTGYVPSQPLRPNLGILFVSAAFASEYIRVLPLLSELLEVDVLIGCSGGGIVGGGHEIEEGPALSLSLAVLPDVALHPFYLRGNQLPDLDAPPSAAGISSCCHRSSRDPPFSWKSWTVGSRRNRRSNGGRQASRPRV